MKTDEERLFDAAQDLAEFFCPSCKEYKGMVDGECIFCV